MKILAKRIRSTIPTVENLDGTIEGLAGGAGSGDIELAGMASKVEAAKIVIRSGIPLVIASGKKNAVLANILNGDDEGTIFVPQQTKS